MRQFSLILLPPLILICTAIQSCTQSPVTMSSPDIPCFFDGVIGQWKQKDCLAKEIPGFAGYTERDCIMTVYLTSIDQEGRARAILEPLYRESRAGRYECESVTRVEVRKARYTWLQLRQWHSDVSDPILMASKGVAAISIDEEKNAVDLFVEEEPDAARAREVLAGLDAPKDAMILRTRAEMERPYMVQVRDGELVIPAFLMDDQQVGELVLGKTTLSQTESMFPKAPSPRFYEGRPRKPEGYPKAKVGEVSPKPKLVFNPWGSMYALFFDENERLVIVLDYSGVFLGKTVAEVSEMYPGLRKTDREEGYYEMQTELTPCAALMLMVREESDEISLEAYVYTCKTK